jgi:hypothetical protein
MVQTTLVGPRATTTPRRTGPDGDDMTPVDEPDVNRLGWEVAALQERVKAFEAKIDHGFASVEARFDRLSTKMDQLTFVGVELYKSEQASQDARIASAVTLAMWALGLVCALVLGAVVTAIATVVG